MKKICFFIDHYLPDETFGGPIKSIKNLYELVKDDYEPSIICRNRRFQGAEFTAKETESVRNEQNVFYISGSIVSIYKHLHANNYDILHINSFFSQISLKVLICYTFMRLKPKVVITPRGEISSGALKIKKIRKRLYLLIIKSFLINKKMTFHATSEHEASAIASYVGNSVKIIPNIPNVVMIDYNRKKQKSRLKFIYLSRITPKKGLLDAIRLFGEYSTKVSNKCEFHIYGPISDNKYSKLCMNLIENYKELGCSIEYKGIVEAVYVEEKLRLYDIFILPTVDENYGHAIVEAIGQGLVPIIGRSTPWYQIARVFGVFYDEDADIVYKKLERFRAMDQVNFLHHSRSIQKETSHLVNLKSIKSAYLSLF
jgi:glycosyltransferase involved in cell wall biosynthesis